MFQTLFENDDFNRPWRKPMTENQNLSIEFLQIEELEAKIAPDSGSVPITFE